MGLGPEIGPPEHERLADEYRLSIWESIVIRGGNLLFAFVARVVDLAVLMFRPRLLPAYGAIWWAEVLRNPYRWPRSFEAVRLVKESGQSLRELMYGEAPVFTAIWVLWRAGVRRGAKVLDLGAGRGRALLAARWLGAEARGVELRPEHVSPVAPALAHVGAKLEVGDAMKVELGTPTHVFLNWCAFGEETRKRITERLKTLPDGTRVIAVSVAAALPVTRRTRGLFTWGPERVFVHSVR